MRLAHLSVPMEQAAITRLRALAALTDSDLALLRGAMDQAKRCAARRELQVEGQDVAEPQLLLSGWAAHIRVIADGRRQIMGMVLPGEIIGVHGGRRPTASSTVVALTDLMVCPAPRAEGAPGLAEAYAIGGALDEAYLFSQITRLGRMTAYERLADFLLEIRERLDRAGLVQGNAFALPLTQETLADATGLTSVHVNRTLQALRRDGVLTLRGGEVILADPTRLAEQVDRRPLRIAA